VTPHRNPENLMSNTTTITDPVIAGLDAYVTGAGPLDDDTRREVLRWAWHRFGPGPLDDGEPVPDLPEVVCLCGSTRFMDAFNAANLRLTHEGRIVLSVGSYTRALEGVSPEEAFGVDVKARLDELHKRKIDLADRIFVLNVGGYIGDSTRGEIAYAEATGKPVDYLEPIDDAGRGSAA
jgi:hypothetical protein